MAKTMQEVLAEHQDIAWDHTTRNAHCGGCDEYLGPLMADMMKQDAWLISHQAAALSAAGYGLVADAKQEALAEAADHMDAVISCGDVAEVAAPVEGEVGRSEAVADRDWLYEEPSHWLRARAAEMRQL